MESFFGDAPPYVIEEIAKSVEDQILTAGGQISPDKLNDYIRVGYKEFLENNSVYMSMSQQTDEGDFSTWENVTRVAYKPGRNYGKALAQTSPEGVKPGDYIGQDAVRAILALQETVPPADAFPPGKIQDRDFQIGSPSTWDEFFDKPGGWRDVPIELVEQRNDPSRFSVYYTNTDGELKPIIVPDKNGKLFNPSISADFYQTPQGQWYANEIKDKSVIHDLNSAAANVPFVGRSLMNYYPDFKIQFFLEWQNKYTEAMKKYENLGLDRKMARAKVIEDLSRYYPDEAGP